MTDWLYVYGWLTGWLYGCVTSWLYVWLVGCMDVWLVGCMGGWSHRYLMYYQVIGSLLVKVPTFM